MVDLFVYKVYDSIWVIVEKSTKHIFRLLRPHTLLIGMLKYMLMRLFNCMGL